MAENSTLEYIILGFLSFGEATGYELKQHIGRSVANFYSASFGSIYPILKRLEQKGWALGNEIFERGKQKKRYKLTDAGRSALIEWLLIPPTMMESELLVRMQFYHLLSKEQIASLFSQFIPNLIKKKALLDREAESLGDDPVISGTILFGRDFNKFLIDWFQTYLKRLK